MEYRVKGHHVRPSDVRAGVQVGAVVVRCDWGVCVEV